MRMGRRRSDGHGALIEALEEGFVHKGCVAIGVLWAIAVFAEEPARSPLRQDSPGTFVALKAVMQTPPRFDYPGIMRIWTLENAPDASTRLLEVNGTINLHFHPDVDHRMFLVEGALLAKVGEKEFLLKPGDFLFVPRQVRHRFSLPTGTKQAIYVTVDTPVPADPKKTVWLEPRPTVPAPRKTDR